MDITNSVISGFANLFKSSPQSEALSETEKPDDSPGFFSNAWEKIKSPFSAIGGFFSGILVKVILLLVVGLMIFIYVRKKVIE